MDQKKLNFICKHIRAMVIHLYIAYISLWNDDVSTVLCIISAILNLMAAKLIMKVIHYEAIYNNLISNF